MSAAIIVVAHDRFAFRWRKSPRSTGRKMTRVELSKRRNSRFPRRRIMGESLNLGSQPAHLGAASSQFLVVASTSGFRLRH